MEEHMNKSDYAEYSEKMEKTIEVMQVNFAAVRAGRANASVLDQLRVDYYGTPTPINQIATIASPDPKTLTIQPWDSSTLKLIEKAIQTSDLGINPQNDGRIIRLLSRSLQRKDVRSLLSR
jgi:ribosome recycling factor